MRLLAGSPRSDAAVAQVVAPAVLGLTLVLVSAGCAGTDRSDADGPTTTHQIVSASSEADVEGGAATVPGSVAPGPTDPDLPDGSAGSPGATFEVVDVPETGVPGLDSDDTFCAAWSRFGGSWQVIQVAANFAPDPTIVPAMEVVASPVVTRAFEAMLAVWPDELADERDAVADGFFGPFDRRAATALDALVAAGATPADIAEIAAAWEEALAGRRPDEPVVTPALPAELWAIVDAASTDFDGRLVGFVADPSMRIVVETPQTDAYLATACPDQGSLAGTEIDEDLDNDPDG